MIKYKLLLLIFLGGCSQYSKVTHEPVSSEQYDPDQVERRANELGLRPVDYLHRVNNERLTFYQAYDPRWNDPSINPVFDSRAEADKYAKDNNMGSNHSYFVREVNYRFEVRQINDTANDVLHTSLLLDDARDYKGEYSKYHTDLFIYDLKSGKIVK